MNLVQDLVVRRPAELRALLEEAGITRRVDPASRLKSVRSSSMLDSWVTPGGVLPNTLRSTVGPKAKAIAARMTTAPKSIGNRERRPPIMPRCCIMATVPGRDTLM